MQQNKTTWATSSIDGTLAVYLFLVSFVGARAPALPPSFPPRLPSACIFILPSLIDVAFITS